ncbi:type III polyketide synthase [Geomicrobium sediminis]|uniref:Alkylresorcinol/alkylpyrone synthase n=1 Tax=Geomicrobium sediminis TaxID=1347788 RepID=A0ABS2P9V5_9BACL|nr:3-oxoacyl-[acyl-carrier-protein] synthase III C-terminal domain-containing protein [Geomicrobium sediminis]MBM7632141.1 alkylresorcinol/alkylpyrone synthase [Geomicrobium sediminis]
MAIIESVATALPKHPVSQDQIASLVRGVFKDKYSDIDRLLRVFNNGDIKERQFVMPLEWYQKPHSFGDKNNEFIERAVELGAEAVTDCLHKAEVHSDEVDALICVTSTGFATPTLDARIMNRLNMNMHTKRIPIWGLGCAGGAAGLSRGFEYCRAFPNARVLVLCIELCSLTFQTGDVSKSNLVGTSLFSDGIACALLQGTDVSSKQKYMPVITGTQSTLMPDSERVMGWDVEDDGLHVVFSRDIPTIVSSWLDDNVIHFLNSIGKSKDDITHFIAHPGGKKVLTAYEDALKLPDGKTNPARDVLRAHGNMSSPTVLYVLKSILEGNTAPHDEGIITALGPGFSSELLWVEWSEHA